MKRRDFLLGCACMALSGPGPAVAQQSSDLADAFSQAENWFLKLFKPLDQLAGNLDRVKYRSALKSLADGFEDVLYDKRRLASALAEQPLSDIQDIVRRLQLSVGSTSRRTRRLASMLKTEIQAQGNEVAESLSKAISDKETWVNKLSNEVTSMSDEDRIKYKQKADTSINALAAATKALGELRAYVEAH